MKKSELRVSIVIPTYNRPDLLDRLLASIKKQTFAGFEVLIVDDNSPNQREYERVIARYTESLNEFYFLRNEKNGGAPYSRNRGIKLAKYDLIALVDDDDEWLPDKLMKQVRLFESSAPNTGLVYSWADSIDQSGNVVYRYRSSHRGNDLSLLLDSCFIPSPTVMVSREAVTRAGLFDEDLPSCQDWDLWTRIVEYGYYYNVVEEVLALHHKHDRPSIGNSARSLQGFYLYYEKHAASYERMMMKKNLSEKYRGLAYQLSHSGNNEFAKLCLQKSLSHWKFNWKSCIRYLQTMCK